MNAKQCVVMLLLMVSTWCAGSGVAEAEEGASVPTQAVTAEFRRGPGVRWGVSAGPGTLVVSSVDSVNGVTRSAAVAFGGIGVMPRIGFQINHTFGLFGEFQLAVMARDENQGTLTALGLSGAAALQVNLGQYFYFAVGPSVGGVGLFATDGSSAWSKTVGGFLARVGVDILSRNRRGLGPSAISLGLEARPMFAAGDNGAVGTVTPILFTAGIESY
jgi:hypothetical protein